MEESPKPVEESPKPVEESPKPVEEFSKPVEEFSKPVEESPKLDQVESDEIFTENQQEILADLTEIFPEVSQNVLSQSILDNTSESLDGLVDLITTQIMENKTK